VAGGAGRQAFERLTDVAKRVLAAAQDEAIARRHRHVGTEHLLLALLRERDGVAARTLADLGIGTGVALAAVEAAGAPGGPAEAEAAAPAPSAPMGGVIAHAFEEARRMGSPSVGPEHLLLGLVAQGGDAAAARTLADRGATLESVRAAVERAQVGGA